MNQEQTTPESPLEKAKRLLAKKESEDNERIETEIQEKLEKEQKLEELNNLKQELEKQLDEINSKLGDSKNEAHETRDIMRKDGLDQNLDYQEEYASIISEVANNLNNLRQEKNRIRAELEMVNLNIENFDIDENITEAKRGVQVETATVESENNEAFQKVKEFPGSSDQDCKDAQEVIDQTNETINKTLNNANETAENIVEDNAAEQKIEKHEGSLKELEPHYKDIKDKLKTKRKEYNNIQDELEVLFLKENTANAHGDKKQADQFREEIEKMIEKQEKLNLGENKFKQLKQYKDKIKELDGQLKPVLDDIKFLKELKEQGEISAEQYQNQIKLLLAKSNDLYEQIAKNSDEADKIKNDKEFGKKDESLEYLDHQERLLIDAVRKELGFDVSVEKKAKEKLSNLGSGDHERLLLNNYLGLDLPVFSQDFELSEFNNNEKRWGGTHKIIDNQSPAGDRNKNKLGDKLASVYNDYIEKAHKLASLPEETKKKLLKLVQEDNALLTLTLAETSTAIGDAFTAHSNADLHCNFLHVGNSQLKIDDKMVNQYELRCTAEKKSSNMIFIFTSFKIAKDNGLVE